MEAMGDAQPLSRTQAGTRGLSAQPLVCHETFPESSVFDPRPVSGESLGCMAMTEIVLRVRLIGGEHLDVTYDEDGGTPGEIVERIISTLAEDNGALRCRHGDRLLVLYGRGVATFEVAPRGAVL